MADSPKDRRDKVRVAAIGAGSMATSMHYASLVTFDDVEMVAICDINAERLNRAGDRFGIEKRYQDYRKMIEDTAPDAVYAIGQPHLMYDIWTWCLSKGLNLFIEKPPGITVHQARSLAYLADKHGCITQVNFQRRRTPLAVKMRRECLRRGDIVHAVCQFYKCDLKPYTEARDHMMDDGVHAIDTLRWICGGEVEEIQAEVKRVGVPDINFISAILRFENGATGVLLTSWSSGRHVFRVEIHAPGVCAEVEHEEKACIYADGDTKGVEYDTREVAGSDDIRVYGGFEASNREFIDSVKSGGQPGSHFGDALRTVEVAEKILAMTVLQGA